MPNDFLTMQGLNLKFLPRRHYDCLAMLANTTVVKVYVWPKTANLIVSTRRVTFSGQVANLGNTLN